MRTWLIVMAAVTGVYAVTAFVGHHIVAGVILAVLAIGAVVSVVRRPQYARGDVPQVSIVVYTALFNGALVAATIVLIIAAAEAGAQKRGGYIGLAVIVGTMSLALTPLTYAMWKRRRAGNDSPSPSS